MLTRFQRDRATHLSLVDQSAERAAARDEAARILSGRSIHTGWADTQPGVDIDRVHRKATLRAELEGWHNAFPSCQGPCQLGRKLCPSPQACAIDDDEPRNARPLPWYVAELIDAPPGIVIALAIVGGIVAIVGALHFVLN